MALSWYYADKQRQQQGPVSDSWLISAYQRGELGLNTLVWNEGMPQWLPLSQVAHELGIDTRGAAPSMPPNMRPPVVAPAKSSSGCLVIGIIAVIGFVIVLSILAAIALPAYQDYKTRSQVMLALNTGTQMRMDVAEFFSREERCPINGDEGFSDAQSYATTEIQKIEIGALQDGRCAIQVIINQIGSTKDTEGEEILLVMDPEMNWTQSSTVPQRYLPASLRDKP